MAAANIITGNVGPSAAPYVAFASVGPALTLRDRLHERWAGPGFIVRMAALVGAGALVAFIATPAAGPVALASCVAFAASFVADTVMYALLSPFAEHTRVNVSNAVSALVDSFVFIALAFGLGTVGVALVFVQFVAKVAGGALWHALTRSREPVEADGNLTVGELDTLRRAV